MPDEVYVLMHAGVGAVSVHPSHQAAAEAMAAWSATAQTNMTIECVPYAE